MCSYDWFYVNLDLYPPDAGSGEAKRMQDTAASVWGAVTSWFTGWSTNTSGVRYRPSYA